MEIRLSSMRSTSIRPVGSDLSLSEGPFRGAGKTAAHQPTERAMVEKQQVQVTGGGPAASLVQEAALSGAAEICSSKRNKARCCCSSVHLITTCPAPEVPV